MKDASAPPRGLQSLLASGVIAVVRLPDASGLEAIAQALVTGGVGAVEVTLTTAGAIGAIARLASDNDLRGCLVGAGTVLDKRAARDVIKAGARFVVSPTFDPGVVRLCRDEDVVYMPGAFTPTEIVAAARAGAPVVKLFPASIAGPGYLRDVLAPLPSLRIVPSGGVTLENAAEWIRAGAAAVSVGTALLSAALLKKGAGAGLTVRARAFVERVAETRRQVAPGAA